MRRLKRLAALSLLSAIILFGPSGCASSPTVINDFCPLADQIGAPMTYSGTQDTAETRAEIDRFNAVWLCTCMNECQP